MDLDFPNIIQTDQNRLRQILINLISNAIKYTLRGGLVKLKAVKIDKYNYMIQVKDTGVGICEEDLPNLFKPYKKIRENR